jgi:DNA integrity scanning protein DisA with diadenylate cyclase activity
MACEHMSRSKTGSLIVIAGGNELKEYADTGEYIDAAISTSLIENIFFKNTPLHDGALIIVGHRLYAAACILPVSKQTDIPKQFGLRHRAALGLSEKSSDSTAIVVSEETGHIAVAKEGKIRNVTRDELIQILSSAMALKSK